MLELQELLFRLQTASFGIYPPWYIIEEGYDAFNPVNRSILRSPQWPEPL